MGVFKKKKALLLGFSLRFFDVSLGPQSLRRRGGSLGEVQRLGEHLGRGMSGRPAELGELVFKKCGDGSKRCQPGTGV